MKKQTLVVFAVVVLAGMVLSACGGAAAPAGEQSRRGAKVNAAQVAFTGIVEAINGSEVTIDGQVVTVDPAVIAAANIAVGDVVKVDATVDATGAVTAQSVEPFEPDVDLPDDAQSPQASDADAHSPDAPHSADGQEISGVVEAIDGDTWTVAGQTFTVDPQTEISGSIAVGDNVNVHVTFNADGSVAVVGIDLAENSLEPGHDVVDNNAADSSLEMTGSVESFDADTIVIDGQTYQVTSQTEMKALVAAGDMVKFEYVVNPDGSLTITEIKQASGTELGNDGDHQAGSSDMSKDSTDDDSSHDSNDDADGADDDN